MASVVNGAEVVALKVAGGQGASAGSQAGRGSTGSWGGGGVGDAGGGPALGAEGGK